MTLEQEANMTEFEYKTILDICAKDGGKLLAEFFACYTPDDQLEIIKAAGYGKHAVTHFVEAMPAAFAEESEADGADWDADLRVDERLEDKALGRAG